MPLKIPYPAPHELRTPEARRFAVVAPKSYDQACIYDGDNGLAILTLPESGFGLHRATMENAITIARALDSGALPYIEH